MPARTSNQINNSNVSQSLWVVLVACLVVLISITQVVSSGATQEREEAMGSPQRRNHGFSERFAMVYNEGADRRGPFRRLTAEKANQRQVGQIPYPSGASLCGTTGEPGGHANITCFVQSTGEITSLPVSWYFYSDALLFAPDAVSSNTDYEKQSSILVFQNKYTGRPYILEFVDQLVWQVAFAPSDIQHAGSIRGMDVLLNHTDGASILYFLNIGKHHRVFY